MLCKRIAEYATTRLEDGPKGERYVVVTALNLKSVWDRGRVHEKLE